MELDTLSVGNFEAQKCNLSRVESGSPLTHSHVGGCIY